MQLNEVSNSARVFSGKSNPKINPKNNPKINLRISGSAWRLFLFALLLIGFHSAQAQFNASLRGTITDQTGAIIPGATVVP